MKQANKYLVFGAAIVIFIIILGLTNNYKTIEKFVSEVLHQLENTTKNSYIENELSIKEIAPSVIYPDPKVQYNRFTAGIDVSKEDVFDKYKSGMLLSGSNIAPGYLDNQNYTVNRCDIPTSHPKEYTQCVNNSYKTHTLSECRANEFC
ncbi:hypothetical protein CCP3SC1AL1_1100010 [Gammaproteobacteria bacterium]